MLQQQQDRCACKCMPNGIVATIAVNVLLWSAVLLSGGAVMDCHVVEADIGPNPPALLLGLVDGTPTDRRGFGFLIHEDSNGDCRWEYWGDDSSDWTSDDTDEAEDYIKEYVDWMGRDWRRATRKAFSTFVLGAAVAIAAGVYGCVAHVRPIRWAMGVATLIVMALQFSVLSAVNSDFCKDRDCKLARSSHLAIAAGILYLVAAPCFILMQDYPGDQDKTMDSINKEQPHPGTLVLEEATLPADNATYTVDYGLQDVELAKETTSTSASPEVIGHGLDGLSDAQEVKPAQIY